MNIGSTSLKTIDWENKLSELKRGPFARYSLRNANCIDFCNEMSVILCNKPLPSEYREVVSYCVEKAVTGVFCAVAGGLITVLGYSVVKIFSQG